MDDLVQWLGKQLDEDEQIARAASDGPWMSYSGPEKQWQSKDELIHPVRTWDHKLGNPVIMTVFWSDSRHISEHDPARVLREIDAKRRILATLRAEGGDRMFADIFRLLALPYADRPGYLESWRP